MNDDLKVVYFPKVPPFSRKQKMTTATETTKTTASKISEDTQKVADAVLAAFEIDTTAGLVTTPVKPLEVASEITGATPEMFATTKKTEALAMAGVTLAVGQIGVKAMKENENLSHVQAVVPMHGDETFTTGVHRSAETLGFGGGEAKTIFGKTHTKFTTTSSSNRGQMKVVRNEVRNLAESLLNAGK